MSQIAHGYRQFDETPVAYLQLGSGAVQTGYLWTSNIPHGMVIYRLRTERDAGGIVELFGKPGGDPSTTPACVI